MRDLIRQMLREQSKPKWTKETVQKEADKYTTSYEFQKNSNSAYQAAVRNGWLDEVTKDYQKLFKFWTKQEVIDLAKKYTRMNHFKLNEPKAYGAARHNKWLDDVRSLFKPAYNTWTKEKIQNIAKNYDRRIDFMTNEPNAYDAARKHGWLDEITKNMDYIQTQWTKEMVQKEANKYANRRDFAEKSNNAYQAARHNGWLEEVTKDMDYLGNLFKRLVYVYEFPDQSVYVGLTLSKEKRNLAHLTSPSSPVYKHIQKTNTQPSYNVISDEYINADDARNLEICTIDKYRLDGWNVLNTRKGGELGGCRRIWNKDDVIEISLKYPTMNEFKKNSPKAYQAARSNKWLDEIRTYLKPVYKTWSIESIKDEMSKYTSINQFRKFDYAAFNAAVRLLGYSNIKDYYNTTS